MVSGTASSLNACACLVCTTLLSPNLGVGHVNTKMPLPHKVFEQLKQLIPPLNGSLHKGQSGEPFESIDPE